MEIFHKSIVIAKIFTTLYFCSNKLNSKKDETTNSIFCNDLGRGHFGFHGPNHCKIYCSWSLRFPPKRSESGRWTTA